MSWYKKLRSETEKRMEKELEEKKKEERRIKAIKENRIAIKRHKRLFGSLIWKTCQKFIKLTSATGWTLIKVNKWEKKYNGEFFCKIKREYVYSSNRKKVQEINFIIEANELIINGEIRQSSRIHESETGRIPNSQPGSQSVSFKDPFSEEKVGNALINVYDSLRNCYKSGDSFNK